MSTDGTTYPRFERDPAFTIRGIDESLAPDGSRRVGAAALPDDPDEQLAALNARAGEILTEQRIVAATTQQLQEAITLAEQDLGVTYDVIRRRRRGLADLGAGEVIVTAEDSMDVDARARLILAERGLDPLTCSQAQYLQAAEAAARVTA